MGLGVIRACAPLRPVRPNDTLQVCGQRVPGHLTIARFRKLACVQDGLSEELFYAVLGRARRPGVG
jgi:hypothetical protein